MSEVTRVNDPHKAPADGVELYAKCVVTKFTTNGMQKLLSIKGQELADCKVMASYETGTVSVSVPGKAMMVSVRIDEVMAVLYEAAAAAKDVAEPVALLGSEHSQCRDEERRLLRPQPHLRAF